MTPVQFDVLIAQIAGLEDAVRSLIKDTRRRESGSGQCVKLFMQSSGSGGGSISNPCSCRGECLRGNP